ncbi:DUF1499 domain-containing protein [Brevundimonas sp. NIBR11]|uniref:DUF1499 domain-containing protein n=1 Tax=Brevundimonas sp. NIBR11 TaxID=3015999 RepID=UPI0022F0CC71|nr:DUF1499 domain-containing protein [Brevundimonas sp. NIBR11]WGM31659.1 hypothetical protein KKHFBJBL_01906 [Brevundimonas sp. NIBR11]
MMKVRIAAGLTVVAPLLTFIAVLLTRNGIVSLDVGLDVLTIQVAQVASWVALAFAVLSLALSLPQFGRLGVVSFVIVLVCGAVAGAFFVQSRAIAVAGPLDVSTDLTEPPAVPGATGTPVGCPGVAAVMRQTAPAEATAALQAAGFSITESQLFRSRGVRDGFWFGMGHEAHIRIRPGRTDVRVVARYDHTDGGETCKIVSQMIDALQTAP